MWEIGMTTNSLSAILYATGTEPTHRKSEIFKLRAVNVYGSGAECILRSP
jgi:hypothetical protein